MRDRILSRRYAKALLDLGLEEKAVERLREELLRINDVFRQEPFALKILSLREFKLEKKEKLLEGLAKALFLSPWMQSFLKILVHRKRIQLFHVIVAVFEELFDEIENVVVAKVRAAEKSSVENLKNSLKGALEKLTGKKVKFEIEEKKSLIGGMEITIGDKIYDATLAGELDRIREEWI